MKLIEKNDSNKNKFISAKTYDRGTINTSNKMEQNKIKKIGNAARCKYLSGQTPTTVQCS